jgi:hypothetical protein
MATSLGLGGLFPFPLLKEAIKRSEVFFNN